MSVSVSEQILYGCFGGFLEPTNYLASEFESEKVIQCGGFSYNRSGIWLEIEDCVWGDGIYRFSLAENLQGAWKTAKVLNDAMDRMGWSKMRVAIDPETESIVFFKKDFMFSYIHSLADVRTELKIQCKVYLYDYSRAVHQKLLNFCIAMLCANRGLRDRGVSRGLCDKGVLKRVSTTIREKKAETGCSNREETAEPDENGKETEKDDENEFDHLPAYVLLEIFDFLPFMRHVNHVRKIQCIQNVIRSARKIN